MNHISFFALALTIIFSICFADLLQSGDLLRALGLSMPAALPTSLDLTPCNSQTRCNGKGFCLGTAKQSTCLCFLGRQGDSCEKESEGFWSDPFGFFDSEQSNPLALPNLLDSELMCTAEDCTSGGVCIGTKTAPICLCYPGKMGLRCESDVTSLLNIDPGAPLTMCSPSDCNNKGVCMGTKNSFVCACQLGYTGPNCENTPFQLCDSRDCSSNGLCIGTRDSFKCACYLGYSGDRCETTPSVFGGWRSTAISSLSNSKSSEGDDVTGTMCESSDCNSNGICVGTKSAKSCICAPGFYGQRCEQRFGILPGTEGLFCETKDCSGNGLCFGNKLLPTCLCAPGFLGLRCEIEPLCTREFQCSGHGFCVGSIKSFSCVCDIGWTGVTCAQNTLLG